MPIDYTTLFFTLGGMVWQRRFGCVVGLNDVADGFAGGEGADGVHGMSVLAL